jgi:hypothetical protein
MVQTFGPAVGSKGQIGYKEETKWGHPASPPNKFLEFLNESVVSEYTNLVSGSLRADRAIHKQRTGSEAAGGDIAFEVGPEGYGTFFKHALGKKRTKRTDIAMILVYDGSDTDVTITVSSTTIVSSNGDLNISLAQSHQLIITAINAVGDWAAYCPWGDGSTGYFPLAIGSKSSAVTTLGASDYTVSGNLTSKLEAITTIPIGASGANHLVFFPINFTYGIYEHTIDADPDIPQGMTLEIGRDIAAFNYYGGKINSLGMTLTPGEIVTGTANMMFKGASTVGDPAVAAGNSTVDFPAFDIVYAGSEVTAVVDFDIDGTRDMFYFEAPNNTKIYHFSLERGYFDHDGYYWHTSTIGGLLEFLEYESGYFTVTRKKGVDATTSSQYLKDSGGEQSILSAVTFYVDGSTVDYTPLFRGNYIGTDAGNSNTFYVKTDTSGTFMGSSDNSSWSTATAIVYGEWLNILDDSDADTGFDIMFPESVTNVIGDTWSFTTFKDENASVSYEAEDPFTGFQGAVTLDGSSQGVMGASFTLTNNLYGEKYELGDRQRAALVAQRRTVEGSLTLEFDDLDMYRKFVNGVAGDINIVLTSDEYINSSTTKHSLAIRMPEIKFSGTTPTVGGEDIIVTDFPFNSLYDDSAGIPDLRLTLTNGQAYI